MCIYFCSLGLFFILYCTACIYYLTCIINPRAHAPHLYYYFRGLNCTAYELALYVGCCVVISLPGGVEPFTAGVEKVRYIKCPYP